MHRRAFLKWSGVLPVAALYACATPSKEGTPVRIVRTLVPNGTPPQEIGFGGFTQISTEKLQAEFLDIESGVQEPLVQTAVTIAQELVAGKRSVVNEISEMAVDPLHFYIPTTSGIAEYWFNGSGYLASATEQVRSTPGDTGPLVSQFDLGIGLPVTSDSWQSFPPVYRGLILLKEMISAGETDDTSRFMFDELNKRKFSFEILDLNGSVLRTNDQLTASDKVHIGWVGVASNTKNGEISPWWRLFDVIPTVVIASIADRLSKANQLDLSNPIFSGTHLVKAIETGNTILVDFNQTLLDFAHAKIYTPLLAQSTIKTDQTGLLQALQSNQKFFEGVMTVAEALYGPLTTPNPPTSFDPRRMSSSRSL